PADQSSVFAADWRKASSPLYLRRPVWLCVQPRERIPLAMSDTASPRRANILLVMFDQLAPRSLPSYGHPMLQAPNLERLSAHGPLFESEYSNSPLCARSRISMMGGQLASPIGAWDNAAEFPATIPTFAHYLRRAGYRTCLSGKMHFVGPDQLHGFEERVT